MSKTLHEVTEAELSVLQALWEAAEAATIRHLTQKLYGRQTTSYYATVQKLLERLENKGFVRRDRSAAVHVFGAAVGRDAFVALRLRNVAEQLCGGAMGPLLTHLVKADRLTAAQRRELRDLIDGLDESKKGESRK